MGKDRKGKELGQGLSQRKDGLYTARFVTKTGYRKQKYFDTLSKARAWLQEAKYEDGHSTLPTFDMVADDIIHGDVELSSLFD